MLILIERFVTKSKDTVEHDPRPIARKPDAAE
jgi:hypothetical protein